MTSRLLLEGFLDVKDPKGSEDRKFWKAWRRLWISFSVIFPPRRREPYLLLNVSRTFSDTPEKEINISRDGLRIFRCRSKSRPYRTWAIASWNKLILYFAAESEIAGQNWMQSVRDGLWPPCFPFQMLTASSQEVSLIDDDNTFLSGLLGVYGRFVLTSEDILSLMHPYWGATLLEISLSNIKDVIFVRETDEVSSPAGVFSIVLKRVEDSKVKSLQFFCNTAKETMQWILGKLFAKYINESSEAPESKTLDNNVISKSSKRVNCGYETTAFVKAKSSISTEKTAETNNNAANITPEYENLQHLKVNTDDSLGIMVNNASNCTYGKVIKINSIGELSEQNLPQQSRKNDHSTVTNNTTENKSPNFIPNDFTYANVMHATDFADIKSLSSFNSDLNKTRNEYENIRHLNEKDVRETSTEITLIDTLQSVVYSVVNKNSSKDIKCKNLKTQFLMHQPSSYENGYIPMVKTLDETDFSSHCLKTNCENTKINCNVKTKGTSNAFLIDNRLEPGMIKSTKVDSISKDNTTIGPNSQLYCTVDKGILKDLDKQAQNIQMYLQSSVKDYRNTNMQNSRLPANLPSDFLDTSIHSVKVKDKMSRQSPSSGDNIDILTWIRDESNGLDFGEHLYADISDRKGTVYEEIDISDDDDDESTTYLPPELPKRPENLEIPDSLRLQKLSKSIKQTLQVMEDKDSATQEYPRTKFIKKIKDVNRIMQISPKQQQASEPFLIKTKWTVGNETIL